MTDNFDAIKAYINLCDPDFDENEDKYYTVEIIQRKKDNPDNPLVKSQHSVKLYYMNRLDDFDRYRDEIVTLCNVFNARAYMSVNCRSYEQVTKNAMVEMATRIANEDYRKPYAVYQSCSAKYVNSQDKRWLIDVDKEDAEGIPLSIEEFTKRIIDAIEKECEPKRKIITVIDSCSGRHIITHPFNTTQFIDRLSDYYTSTDVIKKNAMTILYSAK